MGEYCSDGCIADARDMKVEEKSLKWGGTKALFLGSPRERKRL
jgi:hypothetical protein